MIMSECMWMWLGWKVGIVMGDVCVLTEMKGVCVRYGRISGMLNVYVN